MIHPLWYLIFESTKDIKNIWNQVQKKLLYGYKLAPSIGFQVFRVALSSIKDSQFVPIIFNEGVMSKIVKSKPFYGKALVSLKILY